MLKHCKFKDGTIIKELDFNKSKYSVVICQEDGMFHGCCSHSPVLLSCSDGDRWFVCVSGAFHIIKRAKTLIWIASLEKPKNGTITEEKEEKCK